MTTLFIDVRSFLAFSSHFLPWRSWSIRITSRLLKQLWPFNRPEAPQTNYWRMGSCFTKEISCCMFEDSLFCFLDTHLCYFEKEENTSTTLVLLIVSLLCIFSPVIWRVVSSFRSYRGLNCHPSTSVSLDTGLGIGVILMLFAAPREEARGCACLLEVIDM